MQFLIFFSIFFLVDGQLSINELFYFNSKYTSIGNCSDFQYTFSNIRINSYDYNELIFNCNSSSIIFRNQFQTTSSICQNDEDYSENFRLHFSRLSQKLIEVNQIRLHGIELCSVDNLIQNIYSEYPYYRSRWALLINLKNSNEQEQYHIALATNGEMTFILFLLEKYSIQKSVEIIFPNENIFQFNQSSINIWRIDQGYVRIPKLLENSNNYQLSKTQFTLFDNETFFLYGTHLSNPRQFSAFIDDTPAICKYQHILQCIFPILPLHIHDTHKPMLKVMYYRSSIFNSTLTLNSRIRLGQIPTNHSIFNINTFQVNIDPNLCINESLKSLFSFIIHLSKIDNNGTERYTKFEKNDFEPIDCNITAEIGQEIEKVLHPISIKDIILLNVDLIHQWYNHEDCRSERTRITFI